MGDLRKYLLTIVASFLVGISLLGLGYAWGSSAAQLKHRLADATTKAIASELARTAERTAGVQVNKHAAVVETRLDRVRTTTKTLTEKVPVYVPYTNDVADRISVGLAGLHDAAAVGDASLLPASAGEPDGQASAFAETDLAFAIAFNYGQYHECAERLTGLQDHELARLAFEAAQRGRAGSP